MWSEHSSGRLTTQGEHKPRADFHQNPGTPKVSYLETVWISVNRPLASNDRIEPVCTCMNEWACLCFSNHKCEAVHLKSKKKKKKAQIRESHMIQVCDSLLRQNKFEDKVFYLSDKQWSWPRVRVGHWRGWACCQIWKKRLSFLWFFALDS